MHLGVTAASFPALKVFGGFPPSSMLAPCMQHLARRHMCKGYRGNWLTPLQNVHCQYSGRKVPMINITGIHSQIREEGTPLDLYA